MAVRTQAAPVGPSQHHGLPAASLPLGRSWRAGGLCNTPSKAQGSQELAKVTLGFPQESNTILGNDPTCFKPPSAESHHTHQARPHAGAQDHHVQTQCKASSRKQTSCRVSCEPVNCPRELGLPPRATDPPSQAEARSQENWVCVQLGASRASAHLPNCVGDQWRDSICSEMHKAAIGPLSRAGPTESFQGTLRDSRGLFQGQRCRDVGAFPQVSYQLSLKTAANGGTASRGTSKATVCTSFSGARPSPTLRHPRCH